MVQRLQTIDKGKNKAQKNSYQSSSGEPQNNHEMFLDDSAHDDVVRPIGGEAIEEKTKPTI